MKELVGRIDRCLDGWGDRMREKEVRVPTDLLGGIVFFLFALWVLLVMPGQVAVSESDVVNGRAFPTLLMAVMLVCCAALVVKELVKLVRKQPIAVKTINLLVEVKALVILAILAATYLLCSLTDLFVVGAIFCCIGFLVFFRCKKWHYYVITIAVAVGIWCAFRFGLDVRF